MKKVNLDKLEKWSVIVPTINLSIITEILTQSWRNYLNLYRHQKDDHHIDFSKMYVLSYIKEDIEKELVLKSQIIDTLNEYIEFLNKNPVNNKYISMSPENTPNYKIGESIILDVTSENWEKYKAGSLFVKSYIKKNKEWQFYLDEKGLSKIMNNKNYISYIFYIDEIDLSFDFNKMINLLKSLKTKENINSFFLNYELDTINNLLKNRFHIWTISWNKDSYEEFKLFLKKYNNEKDFCLNEKNINNYIYFITRKLFSLNFKPYSLEKDNEKFNRKEILKSSKTEEKLNSTFSNEIFNLALK